MISTTSAPFTIPNFLQGIRSELHSLVCDLTLKIQQAVSCTPLEIIHTGQWLLELNSKLSRREWAAWLGNALGWTTAIARQFINVAVAFKNFDPFKLGGIEPQALYRVSAKKYHELLEQLCHQDTITQEAIDRLLKESRKKRKTTPQTPWRQTKAGGGRYLKFQANIHDEATGLLIESILEEQGITDQEFLRRAAQLMVKGAGVKSESINGSSIDTEAPELEAAPSVTVRSLTFEVREGIKSCMT